MPGKPARGYTKSKRIDRGYVGMDLKNVRSAMLKTQKRAQREAKGMDILDAGRHIDREEARLQYRIATHSALMALGVSPHTESGKAFRKDITERMLGHLDGVGRPKHEKVLISRAIMHDVSRRIAKRYGHMGLQRFLDVFEMHPNKFRFIEDADVEDMRNTILAKPSPGGRIAIGRAGPKEDLIKKRVAGGAATKDDYRLAARYAMEAVGISPLSKIGRRYQTVLFTLVDRLENAGRKGKSGEQERWHDVHELVNEASGPAGARKFTKLFWKNLDRIAKVRAEH